MYYFSLGDQYMKVPTYMGLIAVILLLTFIFIITGSAGRTAFSKLLSFIVAKQQLARLNNSCC